jgi:hypothetical protein
MDAGMNRLARLAAVACAAFAIATRPHTVAKPVRCHREAVIGKPAARIHCIELLGREQ